MMDMELISLKEESKVAADNKLDGQRMRTDTNGIGQLQKR